MSCLKSPFIWKFALLIYILKKDTFKIRSSCHHRVTICHHEEVFEDLYTSFSYMTSTYSRTWLLVKIPLHTFVELPHRPTVGLRTEEDI